jgi:hypothetical protein
MSELYLLPTPNWFTSRPLDIYFNNNNNDDKNNGVLALSVIGSIYLLDYKFKKYYNCIKSAHVKRINSLAFKNSKFESLLNFSDQILVSEFKNSIFADNVCLLASCSDDLVVKVWDINTKTLLKEHQLHQV